MALNLNIRAFWSKVRVREARRRRMVPELNSLEERKLLSVFRVTGVGDQGPGTLRQAILDANAHPGPDRIVFQIPGSGVHTIRPATDLPDITDAVVIDGYSQPGARANTSPLATNAVLRVEIDGSREVFDSGGAGLHVLVGNCLVRGLAINRFKLAQIWIEQPTNDTSDPVHIPHNVIAGNFLGTDATGTHGFDTSGTGVEDWVIGARIGGSRPCERNLISGNGGDGISLFLAEKSSVYGNLIGTDATGTRALGNAEDGVSIDTGVDERIGGPGHGQRNVISGNGGSGVSFFNSTVEAIAFRVQGNLIGTDVTGTHSIGNLVAGVAGSDESIFVGGNRPGEGNLISGNSGPGVWLDLGSSQVVGNRIGTTLNGKAALGNTGDGVAISSGVPPATVAGNLIAWNGGNGIVLFEGSNPRTRLRPNRVTHNGGEALVLNAPMYSPFPPMVSCF